MPDNALIKQARKLSRSYRIDDGKGFRLSRMDPGDTQHFDSDDKGKAKQLLKDGIDVLADLQERLYAQDRWSVLLIFQAMDAAGKDGAIKHVMSGINPQGCQVFSFKKPSSEEMDHTYLWRCMKRLPERGRIGVFNRSYYEETLIVRVHPQILAGQKIPKKLVTKHIWKERFEDIRNFEQYLARNGTVVCKFFLHVSKEEQLKRFMARLDRPEKNWKFSHDDVAERKHWDKYQKAYQDMIRQTATKHAPWYVVPADHKWFTRLTVASAIIDRLDGLGLRFPRVSAEQKKKLAAARGALARQLKK